MAALCPGVQYGLSSQQNFGENKDLIFVKLTDSALRAIEEYLKNQGKFNGHSPTIKFTGSENGELSFPSLHNGSTSFSFSMSSTADMEGQGGSFECIKQVGPAAAATLEGLGSIPHKIRIHANDDVYEATRNRMTEAEDKYKNKCTREIKPTVNSIGRKVKVTSRPTVLPARREVPSMRQSIQPPPSYQSNVPSKPTPPSHVHSSTNGLSNGLGSNHVSSSRPHLSNNKKPLVPDIARRPLKERLIHLLALRPFKKFELHDRLMKEGLREKNGMSSVLKQISYMKDNCFYLNSHLWNEVKEDWPFYTESERQILKRRKPQNLTPPGGSDGSTGSGQSPTSTHPESPPSIVTSTKRPGYQEGADGFPCKRARIAHGAKPADLPIYRQPVENNSQRRPITDSRDASNMNPRSRESPNTNGYLSSTNGYAANGMLNDKRTTSDDEDRKSSCDSHNLNFGMGREHISVLPTRQSLSPPIKMVVEDQRKEVLAERHNGFTNSVSNWGKQGEVEKARKDHERRSENKYNKVSSSSQNGRVVRVSPDSQTDSLPMEMKSPFDLLNEDANLDLPDYKQEYFTIRDEEQKARYKADYNANYLEYRMLHSVVQELSDRFTYLQEKLRREEEHSPRYNEIKRQIINEYKQYRQNRDQVETVVRFQYLHDKMSYIKSLVLEYKESLGDIQY